MKSADFCFSCGDEKKEMTRRDAALAIDEGDSDDTGDTIFW